MLYALTRSELSELRKGFFQARFTGAEMVMVVYRTDPKVVAKILPKPLRPTRKPIAVAFVGKYPETNFGCVYNEGALFLEAKYKGETGLYCLSMPVDDDMAMIYGRERFGFPKKIAEEITLERDDDHVVGRVVRKGTEILRIEGDLEGEVGLSERIKIGTRGRDLEGNPCRLGVSFLYKHFPSADGKGFDFRPMLIRQVTIFRPQHGLRRCAAEVTVTSSPTDPLGEVPVVEVLECIHGLWDNTMLPGRVVAQPLNVLSFIPHAFFKTDVVPALFADPPPKLGFMEKLRLQRKIQRY
jgi:acetoacetate decarboxylase